MVFKCPCVLKPGTNECLAYDSRYQATSLDEAIKSFVDMTIEETEFGPEFGERKSGCPQCSKTCEQRLRDKLRTVGLLEETLPTLDWTPFKKGGECLKYRFSYRRDKAVYNYGDKRKFSESGVERKLGRKTKRQSSGILGTRFNISCVQKGATWDSDGLLTLCSRCWTWRRLPSGYFPQFLNECICDDKDDMCLSVMENVSLEFVS